MKLEELLAELEKLDPAAAKRARPGRGRGRPPTKRYAVLEAVWEEVMNTRYARWPSEEPMAVTKACRILAERGRTRRHGGGGFEIRFPDGRVSEVSNAETIRRYYNEVQKLADQRDEYMVECVSAYLLKLVRHRRKQAEDLRAYMSMMKEWATNPDRSTP